MVPIVVNHHRHHREVPSPPHGTMIHRDATSAQMDPGRMLLLRLLVPFVRRVSAAAHRLGVDPNAYRVCV